MSKVFVVQEPDPEKFDLSSARRFGELEFLLPKGSSPLTANVSLEELRDALDDYQPTDYLLLVGNPILCALAVVAATERQDRVTFLQWAGPRLGYTKIEVDVYEGENGHAG